MLFPNVPKPARPHVPIGLHMIKHPTDGLLFFEGGRELRVVAYDVSRTDAVVHADGLGLLPIHFYITFDASCRKSARRLARGPRQPAFSMRTACVPSGVKQVDPSRLQKLSTHA